MKLRKFSLVCLSVGMVIAAAGAFMPFMALRDTPNVGIIGGVGAPTYKLLLYNYMNGLPVYLLFFGSVLIVTALICLMFLFAKTILRRKCDVELDQ